MTQVQLTKGQLDRISFLIGDWRGTGFLDYPAPRSRRATYNILAMYKLSPARDQLFFVTFNDNPQTGDMFHCDQGFIYADAGSGGLRIRRHWLMDTDSEGFVTVEAITPREDEKIGFTVIAKEGVPDDFRHDATLERVDSGTFQIRGEVKIGGKTYPYVDKYTRRDKLRPK